MGYAFQYRWTHLPTGKSGYSEVVLNGNHIMKLCAEWNVNPDWVYEPVHFDATRAIDKRQCFFYNRGRFTLITQENSDEV